MLALSLTASVPTYLHAQSPLDEASMEEQLRFFEFLSQSVIKDKEVITPVDFANEDIQTGTSNGESSDHIVKQDDISSSDTEEVVQ